jgi:hypothetical protein
METSRRRLRIIEGPAGSGKSFLINKLVQDGHAMFTPQIAEFIRPRAYLGTEGARLAMLKDHASILSALSVPNPLKPQLIDRCLLSSWVYDTIRRRADPTSKASQQRLTSLFIHNLVWIRHAENEWLIRSGINVWPDELTAWPPDTAPLVQMVVIKPDTYTIKYYREESGRDYPYSISDEYEAYSAGSEALYKTVEPITGLNFSCHQLPYEDGVLGFEQAYDRLVKNPLIPSWELED